MLMQMIIQNGKMMKRTWNEDEINIFIYIFNYDKGVIFLYVNYSEYVYEENLSLKLSNFYQVDNLKIIPKCLDNIVRFII